MLRAGSQKHLRMEMSAFCPAMRKDRGKKTKTITKSLTCLELRLPGLEDGTCIRSHNRFWPSSFSSSPGGGKVQFRVCCEG